jgi:hypothetical protein
MNMRIRIISTLLLAASCTTADPTGKPAAPALGQKIMDRTGRAAINTALIGVLEDTPPKDAKRNAYNSTPPESWRNFTAELAGYLAIYDALDGACGNQLLAGSTATTRYAALAQALADDRLYLNTDSGTCTQYFAVELDATGVARNTDCGGRAPTYDAIDVTYSALAIGAVSGVADGVDADETPISETFPYLAAP